MHTIEIDEDVMLALKQMAEPFVDTPNSVLRRLLKINRSPENTPVHDRSRPDRAASRKAIRKSRSKPGRAPTGSILPEEEYVQPILETLREQGGRAPARQVIDEVGRRLGERLTPLDNESLASGGVRWQNRVQFVRLRLLERGLLEKDSPRGLWELTEQGLKGTCS